MNSVCRCVGLWVLATLLSVAESVPLHGIMRFEAKNERGSWVLLLDKNSKKIKASCYLPQWHKVQEMEGRWLADEQLIECSYAVDLPDGSSANHVCFRGKWRDRTIEGLWHPEDKSPAIPLVWKESHPDGTAALKCVNLKTQSTRTVEGERIGKELTYRYLQLSDQHQAAGLINGHLRLLAYNASVHDQKLRSRIVPTASDIEERVWTQCETTEFEWKDAYLDRFHYSQEVVFNERHLICVRESLYTYTGGAHGYDQYTHHVFSLISGERLTLQDVIKPGYKVPFIARGRLDLLRQGGCTPEQRLDEAGLQRDELPLNNNWWIDARGLGFHYNPYEIACYARGMVRFQITWEQLQPWLDPDAALKGFVRK